VEVVVRGSSSQLAVVTGVSRGIGLEFVRQLAARGTRVVAVARDVRTGLLPELVASAAGVELIPADVTSEADLDRLTTALAGRAIDLLINNAGVWGGDDQALEQVTSETMLATYAVNAIAPVRIVAQLLPMLRAAKAAKVVHVTSGLGSIGDNSSGGNYAYRMSKAALNMAGKSMAVDLRRFGICAAVINPGWVKTDMGGASAQISVEQSVSGMLKAIDGLSPATTGTFLDWRAEPHPW